MNFRRALETLVRHQVAFVVVGGVAVVAHGAGLMTKDLDILYALGDDNVARLKLALDELDAVAYGDARRLRLGIEHLNNRGHHLTETSVGRIDALGSLGKNADILYENVIDEAVAMEAFGVQFLCISLRQLIEVKRELARPRDLLAVMELETLAGLK